MRNITYLEPHQIFVFGSNLSGRHGKGAALTALKKFGAEYGKGIGIQGQSYAIPTKDERLRTLPLIDIKLYIFDFISYARIKTNLQFLVTPIGTGLAGYSVSEIDELFPEDLPNNVVLLWRE